MNDDYFEIKDNCRKGLLKYLLKATSIILAFKKPLMLDIGCGSGVTTLALAENFNGSVIAVDLDTKLIFRLKEKVNEQNLSNRITILNNSLFNMKLEENQFDIIIAEGVLNVVGFEKGFLKVIKLLKKNRFFIIHDEFRNHNKKIEFIESNNCKIINSFRLDEHIWWNCYYKCLEKEISSYGNKNSLEFFKDELKEIELFKKDPSQFNSIYYVIKKY